MTPPPVLGTWEVRVPVSRGPDLPPVVLSGTAHEPTVAVALAVLRGEAGDALRAWLSPRFASDVLALSPGPRQRLLLGLLAEASGAGAESGGGAAAEAADPDAALRALEDAVADAALRMGSREAVMATPWAEFLRMGERQRRIRAEAMLEMATSVRVGQHADASGWGAFTQAMERAAGHGARHGDGHTGRARTRQEGDAERRAADLQAEHIREHLARRRTRGHMLPVTDAEREADAARLAEIQALRQEAPEA